MNIVEEAETRVNALVAAFQDTKDILETLQEHTQRFVDLGMQMMATLKYLRRKHSVDCEEQPKDDEGYCVCGADFITQVVENQAWQIVNAVRKIAGQPSLEYDYETVWTDTDLGGRPVQAIVTSRHG